MSEKENNSKSEEVEDKEKRFSQQKGEQSEGGAGNAEQTGESENFSKENEEDSKLEEKIEDSEEEIDTEQFQEFISQPQFENSSPSLEKMNVQEQRPTFVRLEKDLGRTRGTGNSKRDEDEMKYIPNTENDEEKKYIQYEQPFEEPKKILETELGKDFNPAKKQEVQFSSMYKKEDKNHEEKYSVAKNTDITELGKKPFEKKPKMHYESNH